MAKSKQDQTLARQLLSLSLENGVLSADKVAGVLAYLEKHPPENPLAVLRAYLRLVKVEYAKSQAVVEHAGPLPENVLASIESSMTHRYGRKITAVSRSTPSLLAGVRVRVGDDVYESSVAQQLASLSV